MPNDLGMTKPQCLGRVNQARVSSYGYDRFKLRAYATAGVKEWRLVLEPEKRIDIHRQPQGGQFTERAVHRLGGRMTSALVPSLEVGLDGVLAA